MYQINDDKSIYVTRGDAVNLLITADNNGVPYTFEPGDLIRFKVFAKKDCTDVVLQKDFAVTQKIAVVNIVLDEHDTKIGEVISKPVDYWYEVELNPLSDPQTIIGYDEDGAKVLKLFPEGRDLEEHEYTEEDIPFLDDELDLSSTRPVENQAVARAVTQLREKTQYNAKKITDAESDIAVERARINNALVANTVNNELADIRVGADGNIYASAGDAVRLQAKSLSAKVDRVREENYNTSERNIIEVLRVDKTDNGGIECLLQRDGGLILNGSAAENTSFMLHLDGGVIPQNTGNFYIVWSEKIAIPTTWGVTLYFTDGTSFGASYTNTSHFIPIPTNYIGRKLIRIKLTFGVGWSFANKKLYLYTDFYEDSRFAGYEPQYTVKTSLKSDALFGKKWCSIGDSITANTGNTEEWQKRVADAFGMQHTIVAAGGRTTGGFANDDMYGNIPKDVDIISVMGGTNDCSQSLPLDAEGDEYYLNSGSYAGSIRNLIKMLQNDFPNATVVFCNCLPVRLNVAGVAQDLPWKNGIGLTMADYAEKCLSVCSRAGVPCINLCGESGITDFNAPMYLSDNLHPNALGYEKISDVYIRNFKRFFDK